MEKKILLFFFLAVVFHINAVRNPSLNDMYHHERTNENFVTVHSRYTSYGIFIIKKKEISN